MAKQKPGTAVAGKKKPGPAAPPPAPGGAAAPPPPGEPLAARFRDRLLPDAEGPFRRVPASSIRVNPKNWRTHPQYQTDAMRQVLETVGWVGAMLCRLHDDDSLELLDGHLRKDLADGTPVPVLVCRLTDAEADLVLATHDQISTLAVPDQGKLSDLLGGLKGLNVDLPGVGWPQFQLDQVMGSWTPPAGATGAFPGGGGGGGGGAPAQPAGPPAEFPEVNENIPTEHQCPRCGYAFSGGKLAPATGVDSPGQ